MDPNSVKLSSTYPSAPLVYINNYSNENVRHGQIPPPPPIIRVNILNKSNKLFCLKILFNLYYFLKDSYSCFGRQIEPDDVLIKPLEAHNIKRLYKTNGNYKYELKKLNHSIVMTYLDLLDVLVKAPNKAGKTGRTLREEKLDDLNILFSNMHHLINELRPKQARENLITILEMQRDQRREISEKFQNHLIIIMDLLKQSIGKIKVNNSELNNLLKEFNILIENNKKFLSSQKIETPSSTAAMSNNNRYVAIEQSLNSSMNNEFENVNEMTRDILSSATKLSSSQEEDNNEEIQQNYEYKDRVLCDIIDNFLNNRIDL